MKKEINENVGWLENLAQEKDLWVTEAYESMPSVIAYEYYMLYRLASQGKVYGVMLQLKDVYEAVLKYPTVLALSFLEYKKGEVEDFYIKLMARVLKSNLSLGAWQRIAEELNKLQKESINLPNALEIILEKTLKLFTIAFINGKYLVQWRNENIGHGALRGENNSALQKEIRIMIEKLSVYFGNKGKEAIGNRYDNLILLQGNTKLTGWQVATNRDDEEKFSLRILEKDGKELRLDNLDYILPFEHRIAFFDTYMQDKEKSKYLDYVDGNIKLGLRDYFYTLYTKLDLEKKIDIAKKYEDDISTSEIDWYIDTLEKTYLFEKPQYIYDWFNDIIENKDKGCYMLQMGRGMGKSTITSHVDGRYIHPDGKNYITGNCIVRTYHCSRTQMRGLDDFVMNLNTMFLEEDALAGYVKEIKKKFITIPRGMEEGAEKAVAAMLNSCVTVLQKKIILIIDGIDEITDPIIFSYFPKPDDLADGVFVFYTSRLDLISDNEMLPEGLRTLIGSVQLNEEPWRILPEHNKYRETVKVYANREMEEIYGRNVEEQEYEKIAEKAKYNFLRLRLLIPVYCNGKELGVKSLADEREMFKAFLMFIENKYGNKFFTSRVLPILVVLAIFNDGLTFDEMFVLLEEKMDNKLMLLAALNDLKGVLSVDRSEAGGNLYLLANEAYIKFVKDTYSNILREYKESYLSDIHMAAKTLKKNDDVWDMWNGDNHRWDLEEDNNLLRTYVKKHFPKFLVIRDKLFHLIELDKTKTHLNYGFSDSNLNDLFTEIEALTKQRINWSYNPSYSKNMLPIDIDIVGCFFFLSECVSYSLQEYIKMVEIIYAFYPIVIYLMYDSIKRNYLLNIGEQLVFLAFNLGLHLLSHKNKSELDRWLGFYAEIVYLQCEMEDEFKWRWVNPNGYIIKKANSTDDLKKVEASFLHDYRFNYGGEDIFSANRDLFVWITNLRINIIMQHFNHNNLKQDYEDLKQYLLQLSFEGEKPRYITINNPKTNESFFYQMIEKLRVGDKLGYYELLIEKMRYYPSFSEMCNVFDIYHNVLNEAYTTEAGGLFGINLNELDENKLFSIKIGLNPFFVHGASERFVEYQEIKQLCIDKAVKLKKYYENKIERELPFKYYIYYLKGPIFHYMQYSNSDPGRTDFVSLSDCNAAGRLGDINVKNQIEQTIQWLDDHEEELFASTKLTWIYNCEFYPCYLYLINNDKQKLYKHLKRTRLWQKIWKNNIFGQGRSDRYVFFCTINYLLFTAQYAYDNGEPDISRKIINKYMNEMPKCNYYNVFNEQMVIAWIKCQQIMGLTGGYFEPVFGLFQAELRWLNKEYMKLQNNFDFYTYKILLNMYYILCAFCLNDISPIPLLMKEIRDSKDTADGDNKIEYLDGTRVFAWETTFEFIDIMYSYIAGLINKDKAKHDSEELYKTWDWAYTECGGFTLPDTIWGALFESFCKYIFSSEEFEKINYSISFDSKKYVFTFDGKRFRCDFDFSVFSMPPEALQFDHEPICIEISNEQE